MEKKTITKIAIFTFLIFIIIGFTAPIIGSTFFDNKTEPTSTLPEQLQNPKLCLQDSDCAITCNNQNEPIICIQNFCAKTACDQNPLFYYSYTPTTLTLNIKNSTTELPIITNQTTAFVTSKGNSLSVFSPDLPLFGVLEKVGVTFNQNCMIYFGTKYCQDETHSINLTVNGNSSQLGYVPTEGDKVVLSYS